MADATIKVSSWAAERGLEIERAFNSTEIRVLHRDTRELAFTLHGIELMYANTPESVLKLLEAKYGEITH